MPCPCNSEILCQEKIENVGIQYIEPLRHKFQKIMSNLIGIQDIIDLEQGRSIRGRYVIIIMAILLKNASPLRKNKEYEKQDF